MNTFERFKIAIDFLHSKGIAKSEIAKQVNYAPNRFSEVLAGRNKISTDLIENFCKLYKINLYWLFYGEGEMFNDSVPDKNPNREPLEYRVEKLETLLEKQGFVV